MASPCNCDTFNTNVTIDGNLTLSSGGTLYVSPANVVPPSTPALRVTDGTTGIALSGNPLRLNHDAPVNSPIYLDNGGGNTVLFVGGNGYVGVGTTSPQQALDVTGTVRATGVLLGGDQLMSGALKDSTGTRTNVDAGGCYYAS